MNLLQEIRVPFTIPAPPPKIPTLGIDSLTFSVLDIYHTSDIFAAHVDTKSQAVNTLPQPEITSSSETHTPREWATSFVGEQQELDSIVSDLLTAFPSHSTDGGYPQHSSLIYILQN